MSIKDLADHMKATGRRGDTELVHMTRGEVASLQALAEAGGGSLTVNPQTGLPEAGILRDMLPAFIGFGLAPFTGGLSAAAVGAGAGALLNPEDRLGGAFTGGLGAVGGHGLGAGLSAAGTGAVSAAAGGMGPAVPASMAGVGQGISGLGSEVGRGAFMGQMGGVGGLAKNVGMAAAPMLVGAMTPRGSEPQQDDAVLPEFDFDFSPTGATTTGSEQLRHFNPRFTRRMAEGGIASLAQGGMEAGGFVVAADITSFVGEGNTEAGYDRIAKAIPGAVPIRGKDGGQADTVRTSIEGKQPAAIAHGEMYIPPAAVAGLAGKGTPPAKRREAGAKKLYAMMDSVRQQAKGDAKQIKPVNLKKALA